MMTVEELFEYPNRLVKELSGDLHTAEGKLRKLHVLAEKIEGHMAKLGVSCVRYNGVRAYLAPGVGGKRELVVTPVSYKSMEMIEGLLGGLVYYKDIVERMGELEEFLPAEALEKAVKLREWFGETLARLSCGQQVQVVAEG